MKYADTVTTSTLRERKDNLETSFHVVACISMICSMQTQNFPLFCIEMILIIFYLNAKLLMKKFVRFYLI